MYSFRVRFRLGGRSRIDEPANAIALDDQVVLRARSRDELLETATEGVIEGRGYQSPEDATQAGQAWRDRVQRAFARKGLGAQFGERLGGSVITQHGIAWLEAEHRRRVLNDPPGVTVYETATDPLFATSSAEATVGHSADALKRALAAAARIDERMSDQERVAFELFGASFSETSPEARLLLLVMAIETLIDPAPREASVQQHVDALIYATRAADIPKHQKASLVGSLEWLYNESIGQAGRKLARALGDRTFADMRPEKFFTSAYTMRSRLVHGHAGRPTSAEVGRFAATLETFVGALLSGRLRDESIEPD